MTILTTLACTIGPDGISAPAFADILETLQSQYQSIYGSDVNLDPDTQDGQWLGVLALGFHDTNQATIATFGNFSPASAQGAALSSSVKLNSITRQSASNSSCPVLVGGQAFTQIINGLIGDNLNQGTQWSLPGTVNIPGGGSITVTATCTTAGAVGMPANALTQILTPTAGWQSVNNAIAATAGVAGEKDAELRERQAISTEIPAQSALDGLAGALEQLPGVQSGVVYENDTAIPDANGIPGNSVSAVMIGGDAVQIAQTILTKKTIGCGTHGTTTELVNDAQGIPHSVSFFFAAQQRIVVNVTITPGANYTTGIAAEIQAAVVAYINSLGSGGDVQIIRLYVPAQLQGTFGAAAAGNPDDGLSFELASVAAAIFPATPGSSDITISISQIANCQTADVTIIT